MKENNSYLAKEGIDNFMQDFGIRVIIYEFQWCEGWAKHI